MADLQSKIKFVAIADLAVKTIRELKREYIDLNKAAAGADVGPTRADLAAGTLAAKRAAAAEEKRLAKEAVAAERAAATEAAAAKKAAIADGLAAKRTAAAEEKRLAREAAAADAAAAREAVAAARAAGTAQKAAASEGVAARRAAAAEARRIAAQQAADENRARLAKDAAERNAAQQSLRAARQTREQQRQLSFQVTDIAVGLSTGQSPFYVLLQQGGQLKDTFGGIGNAARALLGIFTPLRVLVGGVAAAFAGIALGAIAGDRESARLNKTLALTGNVAATSLGQVNTLAADIARGQKAAIGSVRDTLTELLASGSITQTSLAATARAVTALQKLTSDSSEDAIKAFDGQADNVTEWAIRSNKAYNFLTAQQVQYIRTLQAQGREQEAIRFANDQLASTLQQRTAPALGTVEKLWIGIKNAISSGKDLLLALGRDTTPEDTVAKLKARLATLQSGSGKRGGANDSSFIAESAAEQKALQARIAFEEKRIAATQAADKKRADAQLAEQKKIFEGTKEYTDAIAQLSATGAQAELANTLAALDKKQAAIEQRNARGLLAATEYNRQINTIDQLRLKAQEATLQRQIEIEAGKQPGTPIETIAQQAAVKQLQSQLIGVRSQISQAASKAQAQASADALDDARRKADEWQQIWQKAYSAIRQFTQQNAQTQAQRITDPLQRAAEESRLAAEQVRVQFEDLQRDLQLRLSLTLDPGQREVLMGQIQELSEQAGRAIDETGRKAQFDSLKTQYGELADLIATKERGIDAEVQRGQRSTESAEAAKRTVREQSLPVLQNILEKLREIAQTPAEQTAVEDIKQRVDDLRDLSDELGTTFRTSAGREFSQVFRDIATGAQTAQGAVKGFISGIASSMLDVISRRLGESLLQSLLPSGGFGGGGGGGFLATAGQFLSSFFHTGGIVGRPGGDRRPVNPGVFAFAPRYHSGGIAGLRPNEVPAILQAGEEVLTANDPRHSRNGGASGGVNVDISVTVTGAQGSTNQQQAAGAGLGSLLESAVQATIDRWATREKRSGGLLAGRS